MTSLLGTPGVRSKEAFRSTFEEVKRAAFLMMAGLPWRSTPLPPGAEGFKWQDCKDETFQVCSFSFHSVGLL